MYQDQWREIYIDGELRHATKSNIPDLVKDFDGPFFVDHPSLPYRRCSQRSLKKGATEHLERGGRVFSSGSWYSLKPPIEEIK